MTPLKAISWYKLAMLAYSIGVFIVYASLLNLTLTEGRRHKKNIYGICPESQKTVQEVSSCPKNQEEWSRRADLMGCSTVDQSCGEKKDFVYHCLPNPYWNKTLEVCALRQRIVLSYCAEYNEKGRRIQTNFEHSCSHADVPCPSYFMSDVSHRYQQCYNLVNKMSPAKRYSPEHAEEAGLSTPSDANRPSVGLILFLLLLLRPHS